MCVTRLSFVIPTRNQASFIRRCIDSCLAQAIDDSEILVMDGASTDGTQAILASYGDKIRWISEPDAGQSDALNKGIGRARGEVIAWINSDDLYPGPDVLARVLREFEDPEVDVVHGGCLVLDEAGALLRAHRSFPVKRMAQVLTSPTGPSMQPAVFFRRKLFLEAGGLRTDLHYAMDYDLWLRMFPRARAIRYLPDPLACATFQKDAKSIAGMGKQIQELRALKRLHRNEFHLTPSDRLSLRVGILSLHAYWAAVRLGLRRVG